MVIPVALSHRKHPPVPVLFVIAGLLYLPGTAVQAQPAVSTRPPHPATPRATRPAIPQAAHLALDRGIRAAKAARKPADYAPAERAFREAARLAPRWPNPLFNLGLILAAQNKPHQARRAFEQYLRLAPHTRDARWLRSKKLPELKRITSKAYRGSHQLRHALQSYRAKRYKRALSAMKRAIGLDPHNGRYRAVQGLVLIKLKQYEHAIPELVEAIRLGHRKLSVYINLAHSYNKLDDPSTAIRHLQKGLALNPDAPSADKARQNLRIYARNRSRINDLERRIGPLSKTFHIGLVVSLLMPSLGSSDAARVRLFKEDVETFASTNAGFLLNLDFDWRASRAISIGLSVTALQTKFREAGYANGDLKQFAFGGQIKFMAALTPRIELRGGLFAGIATYKGSSPLHPGGTEVKISDGTGAVGGISFELVYFFKFFDWMGLLFEVGVIGQPLGFVGQDEERYSMTTPPMLYFALGFVSAL
jgi:tetratricopeptide (TPR) repeat protein